MQLNKYFINNLILIVSLWIVSCQQLITEQAPAITDSPQPTLVIQVSPSSTNQVVSTPTNTLTPIATSLISNTSHKIAIISGFIDIENTTGEFETVYVTEALSDTDIPPSGDYEIRFEDSSGLEIASYKFEPFPFEGIASFVFAFPWNDEVTQIILLKDNIELDSRSASPNPPAISVLSPNGGEELTNQKELIQWEASDADGDTLYFVVQYSMDEGETWQTFVVDFLDQSIEWRLDFLTNTQNGMIRVLASDGFHTSQDTSDSTFSINTSSGSTLFVDIFEEGRTYSGGQSVILEGEAYTNSGSIPQEDVLFIWSSDVDGILAEGQELFVNAQDLTEGKHVITLTAQYEGFQSGFDSIEIEIIR